jgi:hypothetical protein
VLRQAADGQNVLTVYHIRISVELVVMLMMALATEKYPHSYVMNSPHCFVATSSHKKRRHRAPLRRCVLPFFGPDGPISILKVRMVTTQAGSDLKRYSTSSKDSSILAPDAEQFDPDIHPRAHAESAPNKGDESTFFT